MNDVLGWEQKKKTTTTLIKPQRQSTSNSRVSDNNSQYGKSDREGRYTAIVIHHTIAYFNHVGLTVCHRHLSQFSLYFIRCTHRHTYNTGPNEHDTHNKRHTQLWASSYRLNYTYMYIYPTYYRIHVTYERCTLYIPFDDVTFSINFFSLLVIRSKKKKKYKLQNLFGRPTIGSLFVLLLLLLLLLPLLFFIFIIWPSNLCIVPDSVVYYCWLIWN